MLAIEAMGESSSSGPAAAGAVLKHREPAPDHPPYSWMIGEAIAELGEGGGSAEADISDFIRARHPGVPAAHDRFLRHYLAKHVAEGLFACTATGRYSLPLDDDEPVLELEGAPAAAITGSTATEPKRGRGRPRKDASAPTRTLATGKKGRSKSPSATPTLAAAEKGRSKSPSATPKSRGRPPKDGSPAAASAGTPATEGKRGPGRPRKDGSTPAARKKGRSKSPSATPKRGRGRPRVLPRSAAADVPGEALITDMKDGGDAPSATDSNHGQPRELSLVVVNDSSTVPSATEEDCGEAPSAKLPLLAHETAALTTPERSTQPCELAIVAADVSGEGLIANMVDGGDAPSTTENNHGQQRELALVVGSTAPPVTEEDDGGEAPSVKLPLLPKEPAAFTTPERSTEPCELDLTSADEGSARALVADKEDGAQAPLKGSAPVPAQEDVTQTPVEGSDPALVADKEDGTQAPFEEGSAPALVADKEDSLEALFEALAIDKEDVTQTPFKGSAPELVVDKDDGTQTPFEGSAPALLAAKEGSALTLVADKDDLTEPLSTKHKRSRRTCRSAPVKATHAPAWTSIAENKAGGKAASAPPKGPALQCKPASAAAGELRPRRPIKPRKMLLLNAIKPRKMLLLNADALPDHPKFCVLALPAPVPAATKA